MNINSRITENQIYTGYPLSELNVLSVYKQGIPNKEKGFHKDVFGNKAHLSLWYESFSEGVVQNDIPFPDNGQYGETIEYLGIMRAVQAANEKLTVYELGAGFAPWLVVAHTFSKNHSNIKQIKLSAVESDEKRLELIKTNFRHNDIFELRESNRSIYLEIIHGAVSDRNGSISFAVDGMHDWGGAVVEDLEQDYRRRGLCQVTVPAYTVERLIEKENEVDLMHFDIQGSEFKSISTSITAINKKVKSLIVGTHSRQIESELLLLLRDNKWVLVYEKPCKFHHTMRDDNLLNTTYLDGTQFWINTRLWPSIFSWSQASLSARQ